MSYTNPLEILSVKDQVSEAEWALRVDLAAAYRLIALYGWDDLVFTHLSARVPGVENQFLINPYGYMFEEITASSLVKVDLQGQKMMDSPFSINPAGFVIHGAIHEARPDAHCVMHTHSVNGVAVSAQKEGLKPLSQQSLFVLTGMGYHAYEGVALRDEEKPRLVADLGPHSFLMLSNHGLLTCGPTVADAFLRMYIMENACAIQVKAQTTGELTLVPETIVSTMQQQSEKVTKGLGGGLAWPGLIRRLDRRDSSFRN